MKKIGQYTIAKELLRAVNILASRIRKEKIPSDLQDDYARQFLKNLSSHAFIAAYEKGPGYVLFCHLHFLTGKAPYTDKQIIDDVSEWLSDTMSDNVKKAFFPHLRAQSFYESLFTKWRQAENSGGQKFSEYADDFMRWGTAGGAKKTVFLGESYRSKWAWALAHATNEQADLLDHPDLYTKALALPQTAVIALKEEP